MRPLAAWTALGALLHLAWEVAHLPLYTLYTDAPLGTIVYSVAHCTVGDVLITAATFLLACGVARSWSWPWARPWVGLGAAMVGGAGYTAFSEWLNVYVRGAWAYASAMPEVLGIGVSPIAQWIVVPLIQLAILRRMVKTGRAGMVRRRHVGTGAP